MIEVRHSIIPPKAIRRVSASVPDYAAIERLERELLIGPNEHPYGIEPEGLTTEVRVEHERYLREHGLRFPTAVEREAQAEAEARRRWPAFFL